MQRIRRRRFLSNVVGGAGALQALGAPSLLAAGKPPSEQINVAVIGINGMGGYHLRGLLQRDDVRVSALCDVDERVLAKRSKEVETATGKQPKLSIDFRRVLDTNAIDAVIVATPHHWHCPIAIRALQAGKDVYIEKPASHVFREGRAVERAALRYKRVVQHGTQMRSSPVTAAAGEVLASGLIGEVKATKAWNVQRLSGIPPIPDEPIPDGVGDVNGDARLNIVDGLAMIEHIFRAPQELPCDTADANRILLDFDGNGSVSIADPIGVLGFLFRAEAPPALGAGCQPLADCSERCSG